MENILYSPSKIKELRLLKKLTLFELGKRASVSHVTILKYERGSVTKPRYETLTAIAHALGVPVQAILAAKQSPTIDDNLTDAIAGLTPANKAALLGAAIQLLKEQK